MDLHSGRLYWPTTDAPPESDGPLVGCAECDVLVVGAGISGAMAAHSLATAGLKVIVVDRRAPVSGSTAASTALVQYELDKSLADLSEVHGRGAAGRAYLAACEAVDGVAALAARVGAGGAVRARPSLQLAVRDEDIEGLERECELRRSIGLEVDMLLRGELEKRFGMRRPGAMLCRPAVEVNPVRLTHALLDAARRLGARVHAGTEIGLPDSLEDGEARTAGGAVVRARHLVVATGYETPEQYAEVRSLTELRSTYAIVSEPLERPAWGGGAMAWEVGDPYFYCRGTPDGRVMAGGEDERVVEAGARDALIPAKARALVEKLEGLTGTRVRAEFAWAGTFAQTADGLPYIGEHPKWRRVHFALGYGGNGITFAVLAAAIVTGAVVGRPHACAGLFSVTRRGGVGG